VYCYLGAGDYLSPYALEVCADVMKQGPEWITGLICGYNDRGHLVEAQVPFRYRRDLIRSYVYGNFLPYVQQESTFWSGRLHRLVDWSSVRERKLCGDAVIWQQLADHSDLVVVECWLGGFERTRDQLSYRLSDDYHREYQSVCQPLGLSRRVRAMLDYLVWKSPRVLKRKLDHQRYVYCMEESRYRRYGA